MEKEYRINIAISLNSNFMRYTYVCLTSLLENQPAEADVHVYILNSDLTKKDQECLSSLLESYGGTAHLTHIDKNIFPKELPVTGIWTIETYYRLLLTQILPEEMERILYLDVDMIINHSLKELYFTDFEGSLLCVCEDPSHNYDKGLFLEQEQNNFRYFNGGMLLINLRQMREKYRFEDYMKVAEMLEYKMATLDQDLLNYMHWRETKFLDAGRYNMFARTAYVNGQHYEEVKNTVTILHFAGQKPWAGETLHYDVEQIWWDYAKKTPFYFELLEEFVKAATWKPVIYSAVVYLSDENTRLTDENRTLKQNLDESIGLCQKLVQMLQN